MVLNHVWGLFTHPQQEWKNIREERCTIGKCMCSHVLFLSAIPAIAGYIGVTQVGWSYGAGEVHKLTTQSALQIAILTYVVMLVAVFSLGKAIHWMGKTYGSKHCRHPSRWPLIPPRPCGWPGSCSSTRCCGLTCWWPCRRWPTPFTCCIAECR